MCINCELTGFRPLPGPDDALPLISRAPGGAPPQPETATVFRNGAVYTLDPTQPWAQAVAVRGQRIIAVGTDADALAAAGPDATVIDLDGRMVMPGFIEGHIHPLVGSFFAAGVDLQLPTKRDALEALQTHAEIYPEGPVRGFGWRMDMFGPDGPHRADLDVLFPDRPAVLVAIDCHSAWVNSAALAAAGIDRDTADPAPGFSFYARDTAGEPTGFVLEVPAMLPVLDAAEPLTAELFARLLDDWLPQAAAAGITAIFDAGMPPVGDDPSALAGLYAGLDAQGRLPFRVVLSHLVKGAPVDGAVAATLQEATRYDSRLLRGGVLKILGDGTVEGHTAHLLAPYADRPDAVGESALTPQQWQQLVGEADAAGIDLHIHAIGDATVRQALDAIEAAIATNPPRERRHTLAHLQFIDDADLPRFAELGVIAQFSANWLAVDPGTPVITARVGEQRAARQYLIRRLLDSGATVSFGTDWPAASGYSTYRPLDAVESAVTRRTLGDSDAPQLPPGDQCLSLAQALHASTVGPARQLRLDHLVGSLEAGKAADLVVLRDNLFEIPPHRIAATPIDMTMVDGRVTHRGAPDGL